MRLRIAVCLALVASLSLGGVAPRPVPPIEEGCLTDAVPDPDRLERIGNVTPRSYPDPPHPLRLSALREYLAAFEEAYLVNSFLASIQNEDYAAYSVDVFVRSVRGSPGRYTFELQGYSVVRFDRNSDIHGDGVPSARYVLNETAVLRNDTSGSGVTSVVFRCTH